MHGRKTGYCTLEQEDGIVLELREQKEAGMALIFTMEQEASGLSPSHLVCQRSDKHLLLQLGTIGSHGRVGSTEARPIHSLLYSHPFYFRMQNRLK